MEITFLGVGEACDADHGNTSIAINAGSGARVLLDCGFSTPHRYFRDHDDPNALDMVWISHLHGDHFFGLPLLLLRFWEMKRTKPLLIAGHAKVEHTAQQAMELAYPGFANKLGYELEFLAVEPGQTHRIPGLTLRAAPTNHSQPNLGLRLNDGAHAIYYSGDGRPTAQTRELARDCDLIIHEAFLLVDAIDNHGSINGCLELMAATGSARLALVHLERNFRKKQAAAISAILAKNKAVMLPRDGDRLCL